MKRVLVLFVVGVVLFGACSAQGANAQSNDPQQLVGTWGVAISINSIFIDYYSYTYYFSPNGNRLTLLRTGNSSSWSVFVKR